MFGFNLKKKIQAPDSIEGVIVRPSTRARRMSLRVDMKERDVVLTWPKGTSEKMAQKFIQNNTEWISTCRKEIPQKRFFVEGATISVYGQNYIIKHKIGRGVSYFDGEYIVVCGGREHLSRRLQDFLKKEAKKILEEKSKEKMARLDLEFQKIRVIDPKTRWGSCSVNKELMFSWRLILMPPNVLDYVVAHEVAHCIHMNHSADFWGLCRSLTDHEFSSRQWIKKHGKEISAYR